MRGALALLSLVFGLGAPVPVAEPRPRDPVGVTLAGVHVSATAIGCSGDLTEIGSGEARRRDRRLEIHRSGIDEWFEARGDHVEQGFVVSAPPPCRARGGGGLVIAIGEASGARIASDGATALLSGLPCGALEARDARGRELPSRLALEGGRLAIVIDDDEAIYPVAVDPEWQLQQSLNVFGLAGSYGANVAVQGDVALVAAPSAGTDAQGAVYVFTRAGSAWTFSQELTPSDNPSQGYFGTSMAFSGDLAIFGAPSANATGTAYVFTMTGTTFVQSQEIAAPFIGRRSFGSAVALSSDAAMIGADGVLFIYARQGESFVEVQTLDPSGVLDGGTPNDFGAALAIAGDTAFVGAPSAATPGSVLVLGRQGSIWTASQTLSASDATSADEFGAELAVSGSLALVSAVGTGNAYVFTKAGSSWTETQALSGALTFGRSVTVTPELLAVSVDDPSDPIGSFEAFSRHEGSWKLDQLVGAPAIQAGELFGAPVSLDGDTLLVGSLGTNAAFVYTLVPKTGTPCSAASECPTGYCVNDVCCLSPSCPAQGTCNALEQCQLDSGVCSSSPLNEGAVCDAGAGCEATCSAGACVPTTCEPLEAGACDTTTVCAPENECQDFGMCNPATGTCANPSQPDGRPCSAGTCVGGVCTAPSPPASLAGGCACEIDDAGSRSSIALAFVLLTAFARGYRRRR